MLTNDRRLIAYDGHAQTDLSWNDLFAGRRILLCSAIRFGCSRQYYKKLQIDAELYKLLGIDQVYLVTGVQFSQIILNHTCPLTSLYDKDHQLIEMLKTVRNKTHQDTAFLSHYWAFQALFNNGELEHFNDQPTENYLKNMLIDRAVPDGKAASVISRLLVGKEDQFWTPPFLRRLNPTIDSALNLTRTIFYYRLFQNTKLKQHLLDTTQ
ncbi:hypothetical protein UFOVP190_162 [uncultured Caudovirales phage]|uniref:Uncharacterized protein n=1 Tax=uncultured Caudovirales phage TaxID=2100421 RepID=A0A6J7WK52_9CAUD|nr:hypothetical protein UFOVP190_162 [uncultured Caudovirales phage]